MSEDSTGAERLLLGWRGWPHAEWLQGYFPEDLPEDWQLAYFSNDADALYLAEEQWQALDVDEVEEVLEDLPAHFRFYLEASPEALDHRLMVLLGEHLGGLMMADGPDMALGVPVFCQDSPSQWRAKKAGQSVVIAKASTDLRAQRALFEDLPAGTVAVLFEGSGADPAGLGELRLLADMLGS